MLATIQSWDYKKDGQQVKKTYTGKVVYNDRGLATPVVKISGTVTIVILTTKPNIKPLGLLSLLEEMPEQSRPPRVGDVYTEGNAWTERTFYIDATPRLIGPRGALWEWEVQYTVGGVYVDDPTAPQEQDETLLQFSTTVDLEDYATACDLDNKWNVNSAGDFYADPLVFKSGILNLTYQIREYENPLWKSEAFFQMVNSVEWFTFPAGTVKVADISFNATTTRQRGTYYDTTYKLQYRPRGWRIEKADAGFYFLSYGRYVRALHSDGSPTEEPILLNGAGSPLNSGAPYFNYFRMNYSGDLYALGLPDPFTL